MIGFLRGRVAYLLADVCLLDVNGVGYRVFIAGNTHNQLKLGQEAMLFTHTSVREDAIQLYGFYSQEEYDLFQLLLTVSGIGPKGALGILSALTPDDLQMAIVTGDSKAISRAPGVGNKTAQRVVLELKDKLDATEVFSSALDHSHGAGAVVDAGAAAGVYGAQKEAVEALVALGYSNVEASRAVKKVELSEGMTVDQILKASLKNLNFL